MPIDPFAFRSLSSLTELEKTLSGLHRPLSPAMQAAFSGTITTPLTASMRTTMDAARSHDTIFGKQLSMLETISQHMAQTHPWHGTSFQHYSNVGSKSPMVSALSDIVRQSAPYAGALEMAGKLGPLGITGLLEQNRLSASALAEQLVLTGQISTALGNPAVFGTFDAMSAASQMLKQACAFGLASNDTLKMLMTDPVVGGFGLRDYGLLLDAAGLNLRKRPAKVVLLSLGAAVVLRAWIILSTMVRLAVWQPLWLPHKHLGCLASRLWRSVAARMMLHSGLASWRTR